MSRFGWLRVLLIAATAGMIALVLAHATWTPQLRIDNSTWTLHQVNAPVWSPPPKPPREEFELAFHDLPKSGGTIYVELEAQTLFSGVLIAFWPITVVFAFTYHMCRGQSRDLVFETCTRWTWTLPLWGMPAVCICYGSWMVLVFGYMHGVIVVMWREETRILNERAAKESIESNCGGPSIKSQESG